MKVAELADIVAAFKTEVLKEITEIKSQTKDIAVLSDRINKIEEKVDAKMADFQKRLDDLEGQSRRSNVIIHGIAEDDQEETWESTEKKVHDLAKTKMKITEPIAFERCHRLGRRRANGSRPIIAKLSFFKDKQRLFKQAKELKDSGISISEDYVKSVREARSKMVPLMKLAREKGKRASLNYDKLIIDGEKYAVNREGRVVSLRTGNTLTTTDLEN